MTALGGLHRDTQSMGWQVWVQMETQRRLHGEQTSGDMATRRWLGAGGGAGRPARWSSPDSAGLLLKLPQRQREQDTVQRVRPGSVATGRAWSTHGSHHRPPLTHSCWTVLSVFPSLSRNTVSY